MPPPPKTRGRPPKDGVDLSFNDMTSFLTNALRKQAIEPNMLGYKPHPKQDIFHKGNGYGRWFLGGNRSGKSVAGVIEDLWWATKRHPHRRIPEHVQIRGRVVGVDFPNGVEATLFPIFKRWVLPSDLRDGSWEASYDKRERALHFTDGSFIEFKSSDQEVDKHSGTSRHFIHFDEEPPKAIFDENMLRLVDTGIGAWWITMTPVLGMTWMYDTLFEPEEPLPEGLLDIIQVEMDENPHISKEEKGKALAFLDAGGKAAREKGTFVPRGGRVFKEYFEQTHCIQSAKWLPPRDWSVYTSTDYGLRVPSAHLYHAVSPDGITIVTFHEFYGTERLIKDWASDMLEFEDEHGLEIFARTGDPNMKIRNGHDGTSILHEYAEHGIFIGTETVPKDPSIGIQRMTQRFTVNPLTNEPYWTLSTQCKNFNRELKRLRWETYASPKLDDLNNARETVHKKNDHAFDSAKYFATFMHDLRTLVEPDGIKTESIDNPYVKSLVEASQMGGNVWNPGYKTTMWESPPGGRAMEARLGSSNYENPYEGDF